MSRSRRAFSLVEMVVATFIVLVVIVVVSRMLSTSRRGFARGHDTLTAAQHLALVAGHLRTDLAAVDADLDDVTGAIRTDDSSMTLNVRRGASTSSVEYRFDPATSTLVRLEAGSRTPLAKGCLVSFEARASADVTATGQGARSLPLAAATGIRPGRVWVRLSLTVKAADEASGSIRAQPRSMTMVATPVRLNRRLASRWPGPAVLVAASARAAAPVTRP